MFVTSLAECGRLFGSRAKAKTVTGTVENVIINRDKARARTFLDIHFCLTPTTPVRRSIQLCNVVEGPSPDDIAIGNAPGISEYDDVQLLINQQSWDQDQSITTEDCDSQRLNFSEEEEHPPASLAQVAHDVEWHRGSVKVPIKGRRLKTFWSVRFRFSETIREQGGVTNKTPLDYFLTMFPLEHLYTIVRLASKELCEVNKSQTSAGEILKFFGVLILITRYEFGNRNDLWSSVSKNDLLPATNFGPKTGMSRNRFNELFSCIRFSEVAKEDSELSSIKKRWSSVQCFVDAFNKHRAMTVTPSEILCCDESISLWYGLGGHWIEIGLPYYVKIDRKPESGCEIQNLACGRSGIMLRLELVSTAEDECTREYEDTDLHGTAVLKRLVKPWAGTGRIVCADSYYASVNTTEQMEAMGLKFVGVVKQATSKYPMKYLSEHEMEQRGDWHTLVRRDADDNIMQMAVVWMDRERRYFISNTGTDSAGLPYTRVRWRQTDDGPLRLEFTIPQPEIAEIYYSACAKIDHHNRCRQDDLMLEKKVETKSWSFRLNSSILGMIIVDSWFAYRGESGERNHMKPREFYERLCFELVFNKYDHRGRREFRESTVDDRSHLSEKHLPSGIGVHLTPTKKKRKRGDGSPTAYAMQRSCRVCRRKTTNLCSECTDSDIWLCHTTTFRDCFPLHVEEFHR